LAVYVWVIVALVAACGFVEGAIFRMAMSSLWTNRLALRGLNALAMGKAFVRYRNPRRRASGEHQTDFYERTWRAAATELGASWTRLAADVSEIELNGQRTRVMHNFSEIDNPVTLAILHDKALTYRLLREQKLPVPRHAVFTLRSIGAAVEFLRTIGRDCVVKPAAGTGGGRGVTTGIKKVSHLARAAATAAVYADELLIEEQIDGDNYRLLYLDGVLIDAFVRRLPTVVGDGRATVRGLVNQANDERLAAKAGVSQVLISIDLDMRRTLAKQGLSLRSVPENGRSVTLKTVVNENSGADNTTATTMLCRSIVEDGSRAVAALGVRFAGIDLIVRDPAVPLSESGGVVLEVNGTPNLYYHYNKSDGSFPVAVHLLRQLLPAAPEGRSGQAPATILRRETVNV
jgi:D-alanine-D-alanine ligase-like ATP-grasp enzyme